MVHLALAGQPDCLGKGARVGIDAYDSALIKAGERDGLLSPSAAKVRDPLAAYPATEVRKCLLEEPERIAVGLAVAAGVVVSGSRLPGQLSKQPFVRRDHRGPPAPAPAARDHYFPLPGREFRRPLRGDCGVGPAVVF